MLPVSCEFIKSLTYVTDQGTLKHLRDDSNLNKQKLVQSLQNFTGKILSLLKEYLPFDDPVIKEVDLVTLSGRPDETLDKFMNFNKHFNIISEENFRALKDEIEILTAPDIYQLY